MTVSDDALAVSTTVATGLAGVSMTVSATFGGGIEASTGFILPLSALLLVCAASVTGTLRGGPDAGVDS